MNESVKPMDSVMTSHGAAEAKTGGTGVMKTKVAVALVLVGVGYAWFRKAKKSEAVVG